MRRRVAALVSGLALGLAVAVPSVPASAEPLPVVLAGSLQSELGCTEDWDPACTETVLPHVSGTTYAADFTVPAGLYEYKVALGGSWEVNYGAGGTQDGANLPLNLEGAAKVRFSYDNATHIVSVTPHELAGGTTAADAGLAQPSLRGPVTRERFYFVMADRFAVGDSANDTGGLTGSRLETGYDPTDKAFYHGGDLKGLTEKLGYIKGLGTTAIWLTPSFTNKPVQGGPGQESAGYHGYWVTDFTRIDPHLGTNAEMKALVAAAHKQGMKVYFDIITNHTADVIDYREGQYSYRTKKNYPYEDASGTAFDERDYLDRPFPTMDPATSFPYTPFLHPGDEHAKVPDWLNDVTMYHNRGDSTFAGESSTDGDFVGLDDLFTERPEVVTGMGEIYKTWVDFGIDGFRIDTVKHVNLEFWQKFIPDILGEAKRIKNDDFFAFGEVYDANPEVMSRYTTAGRLQATLDFGFQQQGIEFAKGKPAAALADFFGKDDWYTDADSNAYQLPTFLGNHDMGRAAMFLQDAASNERELLARVKFANALMYAVRGNPVVYYGDEQGFIGTGGDQLAREDMFASKVDVYNTEKMLAGPSGSMDRYDRTHPLYTWMRSLAQIRDKHPALADGAQITRYAAAGTGIFAVSRIGADHREYLVAANNGTAPAKASFGTWSRGVFTPVLGADQAVKTGADGGVTVTVPPLTVSIWAANKPLVTAVPAPTVTLTAPSTMVSGRSFVSADLSSGTFAEATFLYRPVGTTAWKLLGTDDNAPFRVSQDVSGMPLGTLLEYRVVAKDAGGQVAADGAWAQVTASAETPVAADLQDPVAQPGAVSVPGTHNSEMGCTGVMGGDWEPACAEAQLALDGNDQVWKRSYTLPPGSYSYKAAIDSSWTENYGSKGERDGANISYETADGKVSFYYDHATHWITSDAEGPILTVAGDFQSELGCAGDWAPACMRPWLQDKDGDGIYAIATTKIPAGTWSFKVAEGLSWATNYGVDGIKDGANLTVTVPADGARTTFVYDSTTHKTVATSS